MDETSISRPPGRDRAWNAYLVFLLVVVGLMMFMNITGLRSGRFRRSLGVEPRESITIGDFVVDAAILAPFKQQGKFMGEAMELYREALPTPEARRRIGALKECTGQPGGLDDLKRVHSADERAMWRAIYGGGAISRDDANEYAARIRRLDLGPLKSGVLFQVYAMAGDTVKSKSFLSEGTAQAMRSLARLMLPLGTGFVAGLVGLALIVVFLSKYSQDLASAPRLTSRPLNGIRGFVFYLTSFILLAEGIRGFIELTLPARVAEGAIPQLVGDFFAMFIAIGLGLAALGGLGRGPEEWREIGLKVRSVGREVIWGVGGYCALLPVVLAAVFLSVRLFKDVQTPQHPLVHLIAGGRPVVLGIALVLACVAAPLVEETAFRGMLYTSLRGKMGVWPAACASAAIFASVHPNLPAGFLPIFALGLVFALLREKSGSLLPSMITHGIFNCVSLVVFWFMT